MPECQGCEFGGECYCLDHGGDDTLNHTDCMIRVKDSHDDEDLKGCDAGCATCHDNPVSGLLHMGVYISGAIGKRPYLRPAANPPNLDARGMLHDLRSGVPHLVPERINYERGACADNGGQDEEDGTVCFGAPCRCWKGAEALAWTTPPYSNCLDIDFTMLGHAVGGLIVDGVFFSGNWPPRASHGTMQCRRFYDNGPMGVLADSERPNQTIVLRESQSDSGCGDDWLIPGSALVITSECDGAYINVPPGHDGQTYIQNQSLACRFLFDQVAIVSNTAELRGDSVLTHDPRVLAIYNAALQMIDTHTFEGDTTVRFDRLDHQLPLYGSNGYMGLYSRAWDGRAMNIMDARLPVVATLPHSQIKWTGQPVNAELVLTWVSFEAHVKLLHTIHYNPWTMETTHGVAPHTTVFIRATLGLRATTSGPIPIEYGGDASVWPTVGSEGNCILLAQEPGQFFDPLRDVLWEGKLDNLTVPSLGAQGYPKAVALGGFAPTVKRAATEAGAWQVHGLPDMLETQPADPCQIYGGAVTFDFRPTTGYVDCVNP